MSKLGKPLFVVLFIIFILIVAFQIFSRESPVEARLDDFTFEFHFEAPIPEVLGQPFAISTNNCNSPVSTIETFTRTRDFTIHANWQLTQAVIDAINRQLGVDLGIEVAQLEAMVERKLTEEIANVNSINVGYTETLAVERRLETPPNSLSTVWLQWEEIRFLGTVAISDSEDSVIGESPFYIVRDLRLSQVYVEITECGSSSIPPPTPDYPSMMQSGIEIIELGDNNYNSNQVIQTKSSLMSIPKLISPEYGEYKGPLSFSWDGADQALYVVTLIHREKGFRHESPPIRGFLWIYDLPAEQYGNWEWYVTTSAGVSSEIKNFVFNPFP